MVNFFLDLRYFSGTNSPAYDAVGNLLTIYDHKMGSPQTQSFAYDNLDRLTSASVTGGSLGLYSESYTYDNNTGNLASKGGVSYYYEDPSHVHAVTRLGNGNTYGYNANGNMTQRNIGGVSYTLEYDAENRLTTVRQGATTIAAFSYDGDGVRVKGTVNGVTTAYVGEILEWTGSTSTMVKYYYAGSNRVAMRVGSNNPKWLLSDHLGSQSVVASYNGLTREGELRYKAWGEIRHTSGTTPTKRQYTGQVNEADIGLYFYNARWYDSALGRWTQPDSIVPLERQGVQAWDRYAFVNNNPLRYNDPTGHMVRSDTDESGCSGRGASCIIELYSRSGDFEGMDDSLRNFVRRNPDYNIYADTSLDDSQRFFIANAQFQVAAEENNLDSAWAYGISFGLLGNIAGGEDAKPQGGVYSLSNPRGQIVRVGHTKNLLARRGQYRRDPNYFDLSFDIEYYINDYATQRGLEQMLYENHTPPLNIYKPISPSNKNRPAYLRAAIEFLERMFGGN